MANHHDQPRNTRHHHSVRLSPPCSNQHQSHHSSPSIPLHSQTQFVHHLHLNRTQKPQLTNPFIYFHYNPDPRPNPRNSNPNTTPSHSIHRPISPSPLPHFSNSSLTFTHQNHYTTSPSSFTFNHHHPSPNSTTLEESNPESQVPDPIEECPRGHLVVTAGHSFEQGMPDRALQVPDRALGLGMCPDAH